MEGTTSHEDQEALKFQAYPYAYYVQSPSSISHANSIDILKNNNNTTSHDDDQMMLVVSGYALSRCSSSLGSNNSFLNDEKKIAENRLIIIDHEEEEEEEEEEDYYYEWIKYFSFRESYSCLWVSLQLSWRILVSLGLALLVFYLSTNPPPPKVSIKMAGMPEFVLGEGVDTSGVATKILTCNCSMHLLVDNKSKLFGLHIHPPILDLSFTHLHLAISHGSKLYTTSESSSLFKLSVGTRNKPMYGAGRNMQDMLESGNGLPLVVRVRLSSNFRVVWNLIKPKYHHQATCFVILGRSYDKNQNTQVYKSHCIMS
ncbi:Delta-latroinsectotoxin-Lt1a [Tripterygium wilfordii]|uniref:Delta-latroinsectotoxin-Lt1a n=1 Tax=Tripterygium wilfordii TaxID=458696 RepID=A0A7J7E247_TRIWF|nr:uncharacterized protein LOC119989794 [Tripterygium wilfordii]KAF5752657.1 Delta-latroinsectotoxin-Lt1a [Tripterygium wilfordii]